MNKFVRLLNKYDNAFVGGVFGVFLTITLLLAADAGFAEATIDHFFSILGYGVSLAVAVIAYRGIMRQVRLQSLLEQRASAMSELVDYFRLADIKEGEFNDLDNPRPEGKTAEWKSFEFAVAKAKFYVSEECVLKLDGLLDAKKQGPDPNKFLEELWADLRAEVRRPVE